MCIIKVSHSIFQLLPHKGFLPSHEINIKQHPVTKILHLNMLQQKLSKGQQEARKYMAALEFRSLLALVEWMQATFFSYK